MPNQFIGLTMLVTLSSPPGAQLRGIVSSVEPGKSLTLRDVTCPANGKYVKEFTISAAEIAELVEAPNENNTTTSNIPVPTIAVPETKFEDPAILSMGKKPIPANQSISTFTQWSPTAMEKVDSVHTVTSRDDRTMEDFPLSTLVEPIQQIYISEVEANSVGDGLILDEKEPQAAVLSSLSKPKRPRKRKNARKAASSDFPEPSIAPTQETAKSKGWRQTPLLEPNPSFQPFTTLKKGKGRGGAGGRMDENGWATEDATDVQDLGDFDFAGSLAKFDKKTVFTQIQAEDSIADEDRLVAHNRLPKAKPGTAGGKNLHYTENVLDIPHGSSRVNDSSWKSEAGETDLDDRASQRDTGSGRAARRADSKIGTSRRPTSRIAGSVTGIHTTHTIPPAFHLIPSDRRCEPISALQMLNLENIADNELGLSEDMMTENAGRGAAEVALSALRTGRRGSAHNKSVGLSTVIIYAGNNKSGLRALAAARHLRNHGLEVFACVLGLERETELLVGVQRQLKALRSFGGKIFTKTELLEHIKTLDTHIDLFIDALLGLTMSFEELRTGDQAAAYELIEFANRSKAPVLAIDIPTGIDPTTGKISIIDGRQLYIHTRYVVAMGAPKKGLLETMTLGEGTGGEDNEPEWELFVADIGLGPAAWKRAGTRVRRGVEFEGSWVLAMRFQEGVE